jgi:hypothetical protein
MNVKLSVSLLLGQRLAMQPGLVEAMQAQHPAWGEELSGLGEEEAEEVNQTLRWRRGWDSNPRYGC